MAPPRASRRGSAIARIRRMPLRVKLSWVVLWVSLINTPLSMFTYAKSEPPVVLFLSWFAIIITCIDVIQTTNVRENQDDEEGTK